MSFPLPQSWRSGWAIVVTKCELNTITGRTDVVAYLDDVPLAPFGLEVDVDREGFDKVRPMIETAIRDQVADALRLAQ